MAAAGDRRALQLRGRGARSRFVATCAPLAILSGCVAVANNDQDTCTLDPAVDCATVGGDGYTCSGSDSPSDDFGIDCSELPGTNPGGSISYCCVGGINTCAADGAVNCQGQGDGYTCSGNDTPEDDFSGVQCGAPVTTSLGSASYCCTTMCQPDGSIDCSGNGIGFSCTGSESPDQDFTGLSCGDGATENSGVVTFCCNGCVQDTSVDCTSGGAGYVCSGTDVPDASLNCSPGTPDPDTGNMDYCCGQ
jgi:hypothetical protein